MASITVVGTKVITDDGRVFDLPKRPGESILIPCPGNLREMAPEEIERRECGVGSKDNNITPVA